MLACESARFEYRAWAATFPELPQPEGEPWREETYLLPPHLASRNVKIRDGALEIKELVSEKDGMQSWHPAAKLEFPIAASALERELLLLLHLGIVLEREVYGPDELLADITEARHDVVAQPVRKRRCRYEVAGCRAETAEIALAGRRRIMSAAVEHENPERLLRAIVTMGLDRFTNLSYPTALARLRADG